MHINLAVAYTRWSIKLPRIVVCVHKYQVSFMAILVFRLNGEHCYLMPKCSTLHV